MGAYEESEHGFLAPEKELLRHAVAGNVPVLGICLGCQLLADALGGRAYAAGEMEVMFAPLQLIGPGNADPVVRMLAEPVLSFHGDTWDPPPGSTVLAVSARFPHAFRLGSALGIQPHPEISSSIARRWFARFSEEKLEASGVDRDTVLAEMAAAEAANAERGTRLFAAWLAEIGAGAA
jgi:GMP synthase (glutamine-hydrolysing)